MNPNGFVDSWSDLIANFQIMRCKPATDASSLKVIVNPLSKLFIFVAVADEAGVVLDWSCCQGASVLDHLVRNTATTQEGFGNITTRFIENINSNV